MPDIIVTGLPRSGSTLVSALIDGLPDSVYLNTPPWQSAFAQKPLDILPLCKWLYGDYRWLRGQMLRGEPVLDFRAADGTALTDGLNDPSQVKDASGAPQPIWMAKPGLTEHFTLAMRQTLLFTSLLPTLVPFDHFTIIAVIRHPLDVLASWQAMADTMPASDAVTARLWPQAAMIAQSTASLPERHVQLYDLMIQRYHELRDHIHIIRYEDVIDDPDIVSRVCAVDARSANAGRVKATARAPMRGDNGELRALLQRYGLFTRLYYPNA